MRGTVTSIHSYRGGTGKSNLTANLAAALIAMGKKIAILDGDVLSPGQHVLFGMNLTESSLTLSDFLMGKCEITETSYDVSTQIGAGGAGQCFLIPSSLDTTTITRLLDKGYDADRLNESFDVLFEQLGIDHLLVDTHPGLNRETLLTTAVSDNLVLVVRPDRQDFQGTAVLVEVAKRLEVPNVSIVANKVLKSLDSTALKTRLEETYGHPVVGSLPLSEDLALNGSRKVFAVAHPNHPITLEVKSIARTLKDRSHS